MSESESKSNSPKMKMNGVTPQKNNQPNGVPPYFNQSISAKKIIKTYNTQTIKVIKIIADSCKLVQINKV